MCDTATLQAIETAVDDKVGKGEAFTAFDISRAAKAQSGIQFRHRDVKHDIHDVIAQRAPSYLRALINIPNVPERPYLYYPQGMDPNSYTPGGQSVVNVTQVQQTTAAALNPAPAFSSPLETIEQDKRGRLWIPSSFINGLGVQYSAPVYVTEVRNPDPNDPSSSIVSLRITTATPAGATSAVEYMVDRHANIAISRGVLVDAGMDGQGKYSVEGTATEVVVKVA